MLIAKSLIYYIKYMNTVHNSHHKTRRPDRTSELYNWADISLESISQQITVFRGKAAVNQ